MKICFLVSINHLNNKFIGVTGGYLFANIEEREQFLQSLTKRETSPIPWHKNQIEN